jgi:hypothetical protein
MHCFEYWPKELYPGQVNFRDLKPQLQNRQNSAILRNNVRKMVFLLHSADSNTTC